MYSKIIKKISFFLIVVFSLMAGNLYGAPLSSKEIFKSAQEAYRYDKNQKALRLFLEFRKEFPKDKRADDALLYINIYALLADNDITDKDRINDLIGMAKSLFYLERLAKESKNDIYAQVYKKSAQDTLKHALALNKDEKKERYLTEQLRKISTDKKNSIRKKTLAKITLELLGKTNSKVDSKVGEMGSEISLKGSYKSPVNNGRQYRISGSFRHDDFTFKTSNFMEDEIDIKIRLIQKTDRFSFKIEKLKDLKSSLNSRLTLKAVYLLAEDDGENYKSINLSEKIGFRFNNNWKLGFLGSASWKSYPDDNDSDRERDYIALKLSPDITRHINKSFNLNFSYSFYLKQYIDSKYYLELLDENGELILDSNNEPIRSNEDKRYLTHRIAILLEGNKKKDLYPSLEYIFTINETVHYDNKINRDNEYRIIKDYGDFMKHKIIAGIAFTGFRDFEIDTDVSAFIKDFSYYPARDSKNQFIDETRKDKSFQFDTSIQYLISSRKENRLGNIFLKIQIFYEYQSSNMKYEVSSKTNYDFFTFSAGLKLDLP